MSKYTLEVIKEVKTDYTFTNPAYLEDLFQRAIIQMKGFGVKYEIGTKWIKIYERVNNLLLFEYEMLNKKEFFEFCKSKGVGFKKK